MDLSGFLNVENAELAYKNHFNFHTQAESFRDFILILLTLSLVTGVSQL